MSAHNASLPSRDDITKPANSSRACKMPTLLSASLLALGCVAVPIGFDADQGAIVVKAAAAEAVTVMTFNQFIGADLGLLAGSDLNAGVVELLEGIAATDFPARAQRQAELIARRLPDLVGIQEVWDLSCVDALPADGQGCEHPSIAAAFVDHLDVTLDALDGLGLDYKAIATVENPGTDTATLNSVPLGGLPFEIDGVGALLIARDRNVILARTDTVIDPVAVSFPDTICLKSADGCNFQAFVPLAIPTPNGLLEVVRRQGFVAVDATVGGRDYRFVNTHFAVHEPAPGNSLSRFFQAAQAAELLGTLDLTTPPGLPLIVVGDMNSSPEHEPVPGPLPLPPPFNTGITPPYMQFVDAGYTDAWTLRPGKAPGFTCCQDPDLANKRSKLSERIDMIFSLEPPDFVTRAQVVGADAVDKTPPPGPRLWPSDHAGVVAGLGFADTTVSSH